MSYQTLHRSLTNTAVAVDTFVSLTDSVGSSNLSANIPNSVSKLIKIDITAVGDVTPRCTAVKVLGQGISQEQIVSGPATSGASSGMVQPFVSIPCDFEVSANASFDIQFAQMSAGSETMSVSVTCYFA